MIESRKGQSIDAQVGLVSLGNRLALKLRLPLTLLGPGLEPLPIGCFVGSVVELMAHDLVV